MSVQQLGAISSLHLRKLHNVLTNASNSNQVYSQETSQIPKRQDVVKRIKKDVEYDVLVIGGGATGAGVALDAALRGLSVACLEREDFASGTSSRSTKLIWGGSRYLVTAFVSLFRGDLRLLKHPEETIRKFIAEFKMVLNCHKERKFLLQEQPHLTQWLPIAVPLTRWFIWPPPFDFAPASIGPIGVFPVFFKFYDFLSGFSCPPSTVLTKSEISSRFPQLDESKLIYCPVFYEGQHDDARTNLAIALTAAKHGADISNYCEVVELVRGTDGKQVVGVRYRDRVTNEVAEVRAKAVVFCGGPFTDELRKLENQEAKDIVVGAGGTHIVIPGHFAPKDLGMVDMSTSDGRFLFFLPWQGHVLVGTTDRATKPSMSPKPSEEEIEWLVNEASKYLKPDKKLNRSDVKSAWCGVRPLVADSGSAKTASVSRDHVVSYDDNSRVIFVAGGKWTTYREMAEDAVNKVIQKFPEIDAVKVKQCKTLSTKLIGYEGYSPMLPQQLVKDFSIDQGLAEHLTRAFGGRAVDVIKIAQGEGLGFTKISPDFPYTTAEIVYSCRHEWAVHVVDVLCRRTRLAFLDRNAALAAIPMVVDIMAKEFQWNDARKAQEIKDANEYMQQFTC